MKGKFLVNSNEDPALANIYADKSALVLSWLLKTGINKPGFSIREAAKDIGVSVGLVQRVFNILVLKGLLLTEGVRTAKKFFFKQAKPLLEDWLKHYAIAKKCKMRTYQSGIDRAELLDVLAQSKLNQNVALALHSAADAYGCKNTNLKTLELYLLDPKILSKLEKTLYLEPQERGYEILLIEPYYEHLLIEAHDSHKDIKLSPPLLTYLDLYHFPLRGREQADFMAKRMNIL
jgi:DNA-binding transcriptional regulator YhcF (GntR family)